MPLCVGVAVLLLAERPRIGRGSGALLDWALIALGATGADFLVLSPPELAARVADWGARFTRAVQPP